MPKQIQENVRGGEVSNRIFPGGFKNGAEVTLKRNHYFLSNKRRKKLILQAKWLLLFSFHSLNLLIQNHSYYTCLHSSFLGSVWSIRARLVQLPANPCCDGLNKIYSHEPTCLCLLIYSCQALQHSSQFILLLLLPGYIISSQKITLAQQVLKSRQVQRTTLLRISHFPPKFSPSAPKLNIKGITYQQELPLISFYFISKPSGSSSIKTHQLHGG
ncbi:hypothetical protein YC2023_078829 [Brassica napus]